MTHNSTGIVWGFAGFSKHTESEIQIFRYYDEESKNKAIISLELLKFRDINSASDDDLNVDYSDLIRVSNEYRGNGSELEKITP